ncbi:hypothetical protein PVK06_024407 [Gossypium arboreum]|uniref:Uncharacterized protein n=1 Tax=Gossypium arboreum TaxID=29729 RepID=A0ABR0PDS9_GOSAR|nr:hypothetical protein PVK06_024407 [Gossypium arboreum]
MVNDRGMDCRKTLTVKRRGGSSGLQIVKDVATRLRSGYELDAIILERNEGRLRVNRWCWILSESGFLIIHLSWETCGIKRALPEGDSGGRRRIGMDLNGRGAYHRLVYYRMLLLPSATSNECGQR